MREIFFTILIFSFSLNIKAQQLYCDFEGTKVIHFGLSTGVLDTLISNPAPNSVNSSTMCAKYIRDTSTYDFIKMYPDTKLVDVTPYANNAFQTPKIRMKLYSTAPAGTTVLLQLGIKNVDNYPAGVHSEYIALTNTQNGWQQLTFNYFQSPTGSLASPTNIDKIVLLFRPNSSARDTIYFDDLSGPPLVNTLGITQEDAITSFKLLQNNPNPAKENTRISFQLNSSGYVSLNLYDLLGNHAAVIIEQHMKAGTYSIPFETENIPDGIYFCTMRKDGYFQTIRMLVAK